MASKKVRASFASACTSEAGSSSDTRSSSESSSSETGSSSEVGSTSEVGSASEASCSGDQLPTSTTDFFACSSSPESDDEQIVEEATNKVRRTLIETGQMDRLKDIIERRLNEIGWRQDMMGKCREVVKIHGSSTSFEMLFQNVRQFGKDQIPEEVKRESLLRVKDCYESLLKK